MLSALHDGHNTEVQAAGANVDYVNGGTVVRWEFLRHVPSQALEGVHAAALVRLSDAAAAAVSQVDAIARDLRSGRRGRRPNQAVRIYGRRLAWILGGYIEVQRRARMQIGGPEDGFEFRLPPDQAKRLDADIAAEAKRKKAEVERKTAENERLRAKLKRLRAEIEGEEGQGEDWES